MTRLPGRYCLGCGTTIDAASSAIGDHKPSPGDFTVCLYCGHVMVFRKHGRRIVLGNPNTEEIRQIAGNETVLKIQRARQIFKTEK